jgi:hypothetical protein
MIDGYVAKTPVCYEDRDYLSAMYEGAKGRILMTMALGGIAAAYFWSMKLTKIEV